MTDASEIGGTAPATRPLTIAEVAVGLDAAELVLSDSLRLWRLKAAVHLTLAQHALARAANNYDRAVRVAQAPCDWFMSAAYVELLRRRPERAARYLQDARARFGDLPALSAFERDYGLQLEGLFPSQTAPIICVKDITRMFEEIAQDAARLGARITPRRMTPPGRSRPVQPRPSAGARIFNSPRLSVFEHAGEGDDLWITFSFYASDEEFGEDFLRKRRLPRLHFVSKTPEWFQYPEIFEAVQIAAERSARVNGKVVLYGSSMGAFAALAFSKRLHATHVIAASPQVSISPEIVGSFENRWTETAETIEFVFPDCRAELSDTAQIALLYDNLVTADRKHVRMLEGPANVRSYAFPLAGHGMMHALNAAGLLQDFLFDLLDTPEAAAAAYRRNYKLYRQTRRETPQFHLITGEWYFRRSRLSRARQWFERALEMVPNYWSAQAYLHHIALKADDPMRSLPYLLQAHPVLPVGGRALVEAMCRRGAANTPSEWCAAGAALITLGLHAEAETLAKAALAAMPGEAVLLQLAAAAQQASAQNHIGAAEESLRRAARLRTAPERSGEPTAGQSILAYKTAADA